MAEKKQTLNEKIKGLTIFSLNGNNFLGKIDENTENTLKVTESITIKTADFKEVIKDWIKADNLNQLEEFEVKGNNNTLVTKGFTEEKLMVIDIVSSQADYAMKYAVGNLQNDAIK